MDNQDQPQNYKEKLQEKIVDTMIHSVEKEEITEDMMSEIAAYVLDNMEGVTDKNTAIPFLKDLSAQWDIFAHILHVEEGHVQDQVEEAVTQAVLALLERGKIDNAIELAKSATHPNSTQ